MHAQLHRGHQRVHLNRVTQVLVLCVLAACGGSEVETCDGAVCPDGQACALAWGRCVEVEQLEACADLDDGTSCAYPDVPTGHCLDNVCVAASCGDGFFDPPENCEGDDLGGATCLDLGFYDEPGLACQFSCYYDTSACTGYCGDGVLNGPEVCDGTNVPTCEELGYAGGAATCNPNCSVNNNGCTP